MGSSNLHPLNRNNLPQHLASSTLFSYFLIPLNSPCSLAVIALVLPEVGSASKYTHFAENALPACSLVSYAYPIRTVFTLRYNSSFHLPMEGANGGLLND